MIGACGQWIPCAVLLATCLGAERLPYGFRMFLLYFGIMGANLGGVFNSAAYLYNQSHYNIAISSKTSGVHSNSAGTQGASHGRKSEAAKGDGPANGSFKHLTVQPSGAHGSTPKINTADTSLTNVTATSRHELDRKVQL
ncbi:hypothetical protein DFS34DRAFT_212991 [Phlyctochytrium arcticum]|nr:hypothetical protein DFS34DRAFT_212991 [Phlyctochytrium arcticum]